MCFSNLKNHFSILSMNVNLNNTKSNVLNQKFALGCAIVRDAKVFPHGRAIVELRCKTTCLYAYGNCENPSSNRGNNNLCHS